MAVLTTSKRMVFWELCIGGIDVTNMLKQYISGIKINYKINGVSSTDISVTSPSFIEDVFVPGQTVDIKLGYDRYNLVDMFSGKIKKHPSGSATDKISYKLNAVSNPVNMANRTNNRVFRGLIKSAIINQIAAMNGYVPDVYISDMNVIPAGNVPIQNNQTDLEFLVDCAERWNCVMWFTEPNTLHFYDSDVAHSAGDSQRTLTTEDLLPDYILGYRTDQVQNNLKSVAWSFKQKKGGGPGSPGATGANEDGETETEDDYTIEYNDITYRLKPAEIQAVQNNTMRWFELAGIVYNSNIEDVEATLQQYFVPVTHGSQTRNNMSSTPSHRRGALELKCKLNIGDPYLRPPRHAKLYCGSLNPRADTSELPAFLFRHSRPQRFKINEINMEYKNGAIETELIMTLGEQNG